LLLRTARLHNPSLHNFRDGIVIKAEIEPVKQEIQKLHVKVDNLQLDVDAIRDAVIEE